jgi:hypothetical protein
MEKLEKREDGRGEQERKEGNKGKTLGWERGIEWKKEKGDERKRRT